MSRKRMTTLPFLLLALSLFVIFGSDYALISYLLCKSSTLWNILMILGNNEERPDGISHTRMTTLAFFYFWSFLPILCLNLISCLCSVTQIPFGIF